MKVASLIFFFVTFFGLESLQAFSQCSCLAQYRDIKAYDEFKLANVVFVGKVTEIKKSHLDKKTNHYIETVRFEVKKVWKRDLDSIIILENKISGCINGYMKDEEWLVYAYKDRDGKLHSYCCCSRTRLLSEATNDLKEFDINDAATKTIHKK